MRSRHLDALADQIHVPVSDRPPIEDVLVPRKPLPNVFMRVTPDADARVVIQADEVQNPARKRTGFALRSQNFLR